MYREWIAMEHHRIHVMEMWPDGPAKIAGLAAAHASLERLVREAPPEAADFACIVCAGRQRTGLTLVEHSPRLSAVEAPGLAA
jgi:hypothetical protein